MAKNVFRAAEIKLLNSRVQVLPPERFSALSEPEEVETLESVDQWSGPTADDLRREAELFKKNWDTEKDEMMKSAREEAERIISDAEQTAFDEVKRKNDQAQSIRQSAEREAEQILEDARTKAEATVREAEENAQAIRDAAREEGLNAGREDGFAEGAAESDRLIEQIHSVLNKAIERRNDLLEESEAQIVHLVLSIARKVVKAISENQRQVVMQNIVQALQKLKHKGDVVIRVNSVDVAMTTEHSRELTRRMEKVGYVTVLEDTSIEPGGCIIETDFGEIDARISAQLREIEERIMEMVPVKVRERPGQP